MSNDDDDLLSLLSNAPWGDEPVSEPDEGLAVRASTEAVKAAVAQSLEQAHMRAAKRDSVEVRLIDIPATLERAKRAFNLDDYTQVLRLTEAILRTEPGNPDALDLRTRGTPRFLEMYSSQIGNLDRVAQVIADPDSIMWLNLTVPQAEILSAVDGEKTFRQILVESSMSVVRKYHFVARLVRQKLLA